MLAHLSKEEKKISAICKYCIVEHSWEGAVHFTSFVTESPIPHLQRVLDEVGRCGFELNAVTLDSGQAAARVRIEFRPVGNVGARTLVARIARIPTIMSVEDGPVDCETPVVQEIMV
jgi:acetolactate synthase regulatory subunit